MTKVTGKLLIALLAFLVTASAARTQFVDNFDGSELVGDTSGLNGWAYFTGDGSAVMKFSESGKGYATICVDATKDKRGIWWALIKRRVSGKMNLELMTKPKFEMRIEARIRVSQAPKRVNLSLNTNRTTDFHTNLMEFDLPDTVNWHTISMTTRHFDALPGDTVFGQLALMDWGLSKYCVDIDYFRVDIVDADTTGPDSGVQVPYHPPIRSVDEFSNHVPAAQGAMIDLEYTGLNFNNWQAGDGAGETEVLTVSGTQYVILRWDLSRFRGRRIEGSGLLELATYSLQRSADYAKDFGMIRVCEIMGGDPEWDGRSVTFDSFTGGEPLEMTINSQMIIDVDVNPVRGGKNFITVPNPVLQRMIDGRTPGIAIKPLGAVNVSFYRSRSPDEKPGALLHLNFAPGPSSDETAK